MSLISTLFTGVSGLSGQSKAMEIIGDNIANVNTVGFKGSSPVFGDIFSTVLHNGAVTSQLGGGSQLAGVLQVWDQGAIEHSANALDIAIDGNGFFVTSTHGVPDQFYTRNGQFRLNELGLVQSMTGEILKGFEYTSPDVLSTTMEDIDLAGVQSSPGASTYFNTGTQLNAAATATSTFITPVTLYNSVGSIVTLNVTFTKVASANKWGYSAVPSEGTITAGATGTVTFDTSGQLSLVDGETAADHTFEIDFSSPGIGQDVAEYCEEELDTNQQFVADLNYNLDNNIRDINMVASRRQKLLLVPEVIGHHRGGVDGALLLSLVAVQRAVARVTVVVVGAVCILAAQADVLAAGADAGLAGLVGGALVAVVADHRLGRWAVLAHGKVAGGAGGTDDLDLLDRCHRALAGLRLAGVDGAGVGVVADLGLAGRARAGLAGVADGAQAAVGVAALAVDGLAVPTPAQGRGEGRQIERERCQENGGAHLPRRRLHAGRDHYPAVYSLALAGGGIRGGQCYGSSDTSGAQPATNACTPADFHATVYKAMGINHHTELHDHLDRPYRVCDGQPLPLF